MVDAVRMGRQGVRPVLAVLAALVAIGAICVHWFFGSLTCGMDTSYCADTRVKNGYYTGEILEEPDTLRGTRFSVGFESRRGEPKVRFERRPGTPFCLVWAEESATPFVTGTRGSAGLREFVEGAPPPGCVSVSEGIPWNRAEDLKSSWQYRSVWILGAIGLAVMFCALVLEGPAGRRLRTFGAVLCLLTPVWALMIWNA